MTRVFAAHRPDTVAIADRVISLDKYADKTTRQAAAGQNNNHNQHSVAETQPKTRIYHGDAETRSLHGEMLWRANQNQKQPQNPENTEKSRSGK